MKRRSLSLSLLFAFCLLHFPAFSAEPTPQQLQFFESKIRPLFVANCYKCHSRQAEKIKGGLLLDTRDGLLKGGDSGAAIVPGNPGKSLLIKAVLYTDPDLQMPPKNQKLSDNQIADLENWIKMGAPDPRTASAAPTNWADAKSHWAWQPLTMPAVPEVQDADWCKTPVDNFILAKLEEKNLKPNPPADKRTLIRRATFDLTGLPPTPEEVQDFVNDDSPDAFEKVVDRLLASPQYGECWARHWLDVARYSDTKGQVRRQVEDPNYPFAWTYRDYVIRSFNDDKPYNLFVIEQLAADKLPYTAQNPTNLTALGFLTVGDRFMEMQNDIINDRIDVTTKAFLGLTVSCARCHDHKFDPIPTKDYYSLYGIFSSCYEPSVEPVLGKIQETPEYESYYRRWLKLEEEKNALQVQLRAYQKARDRDNVKITQRNITFNSAAIARLEMNDPGAPARAMVLLDLPKPHDSHVLIRGEPGNFGDIEPRHFLELLSSANPPVFTNGSGRLQLAHAIVSKTNPLTPRVMVNRIWQYLFGEGIVTTPDDLGTRAEPPSHPELLDYLASQFEDNGWSVKKIQRLIMLSAVYQESSDDNPRFAEVDPDNRLLWRANIRRLEYEAIRDSLLAIGGTLNKTMFGKPVNFSQNPNSTRRTIYGLVDRSDVDDVMVNFDFADPDMPNGRRHDTIVPQQALFFMNSPLVVEQARRLVALPEFGDLTNDDARVQFLYERIYQRLPRPEETQMASDFIAQSPATNSVPAIAPDPTPNPDDGKKLRQKQLQKQMARNRSGTPKPVPLKPWEEYAQALLEANEMCFVN